MTNEGLIRLSTIRTQRKLSFDTLAKMTDIPATTLRRYFNGVNDIPAEALYLIAEALGTTVEFLRFGHDITSVSKHSDAVNNIAANLERLNDDGLHKVEDYVDDLLENNKYLK